VNANSSIRIETVTGTDSVESSDEVEDDVSDNENDCVFLDNVAELPALD